MQKHLTRNWYRECFTCAKVFSWHRILITVLIAILTMVYSDGTAVAQSPFPYPLPFCPANDITGSASNMRLVKACGCPTDMMEVEYDLTINMQNNGTRYDIQYGYVQGGNITGGGCVSDLTDSAGNPLPFISNEDGQTDCGDIGGGNNGISQTLNGVKVFLSCDINNDGWIDTTSNLQIALGFESNSNSFVDGNDEIEQPKCNPGTPFAFNSGVFVELNKVSSDPSGLTPGVGTFPLTGNNICHNPMNLTTQVQGTAVTTYTGATNWDPVNQAFITPLIIGENVPLNWSLSDLTCNQPGTKDLVAGTYSIAATDFALGDSISCTATNVRDTATLTLTKVVTNDHGGTAAPSAWTLSYTGSADAASVTGSGATGTANVTNQFIPAGLYTLVESGGPSDYNLTSITCDGSDTDGSDGLLLANGENVTCVFTNDDRPATLTLIKNVDNTGGGTASATDWTLTASGLTPILGPSGSVTVTNAAVGVGTYMLSESSVNDYTQTSLVCSGGADTNPSDGLTLTVDENVICTFTNTFVPKPNIEAVKTIANTLPNPVQVNDIISYTIVVSNTGNVPLSNISFNDTLTDGDGNTYSLSSGPTYTSGDLNTDNSLAITETWTYVASFALPQAVIDSGVISNTVTAIGTPPLGPNVSDISDNGDDTDGNTSDDPTVQTLSPQSGLLLDKAATPNPNTLILGDTITYTFVATNTGNVTLDSVTITDGMSGLSSLSCDQTIPANDFAPNEVLTCTATYVVTQADVDAGSIVNNATVSGTAPDGSSTNDSDDETVSGVPNPQIEAVKTVANTLSNPVQAGDVITYTITVDNIGNQSLSNITLDDTLTDGSGNVLTITGPTYVSGDTNIDNNLAVTETWTYAASFALTQSVIDSGGITNTVTVTGTSPSGTDVSDVSDDGDDSDGNTSDDPTEQVLTSQPRLALDKMATLNPSNLVLGDTIAYTFVAINTGNVTLDNVDINDPMSGLSALSCTLATAVGGAGEIALQNFDSTTYLPFLSTSAGTNIHSAATADSDIVKGASAVVAVTLPYDNFLPGETLTCTATYIVTQNDVNIGSIVNNATVNGTAPDGSSINDSDGETVPGVPNPQIEALKIVANTLPSLVQAGDVITYTITVDNTGNQTLSNITLDDTLTDGNGNALIITGPTYVSGDTNIDSNLAVTETWTYVASFALTQDVIDSGGITNTVTVTGTSPSGTDVSDISDDGDDTDGNTSDDPTGLTLGPKPKIQLTKSVGVVTDANSNVTTDAGDTIAYTFTLLNSGNVTLSPLSIVDNKVANISCLANSLAPGVSTTCTGDPYLILQADVNVGGVENSATAFGTPPAGPPVSDVSDSGEGTEEIETDDLNGQIDGDPTNDPTVTLIQPQPVLELIKVGVLDDGGNGRADPGDVINYRFTISNTGSVDISNITISDPILDTVNGGPIALLPAYGSDSTTFSGSLTLTSSIIASGGITNTATATGTAPDGSSVSDISDDPTEMSNTDINGNGNGDDPTFVPLMPQPAISLEKVGNWIDADNNGTAEVGETISYSFGVRNSGNVNLTNVTITDPLVSVSGGPIPTLAVGALDSTTFTAVYTLTSADIAAGAIINQATATGNDPSGNPVRDDSDDPTDATDIDPDGDGDPDDPTVTPLVPQPRITLTKEATFNDEDGDGLTEVDETISYAFTVWNTGNIDLFNVTIDDPLITVSGGPISTLPIGTIDNTTFNGLYTITERDIVAGEVINQATANGNSADDGSGTNVTDLSDDPSDLTNQDIDGDGDPDDPTVLPLTMLPRMSLIKAGTFNDEDGDGNAQPGETISYSFTVVNTGNVELTNITITDPIVSVSGGPLASLGIGASDSTTFSAVYKLTSADIAAKEVINQAIATGDDPRGNPVSDDSDDPNDLTNIDPDNDGEPDDPTIVQLTPVPDISLLKTSVFNDENGDGYAQVDETISYSFVVLNTGNVDLSNITISDPLVTLSGGPIPFLAVGDSDSNTFSGTYTLQISDLASDAITNTATVNATDPDGFPVRDVSDDPRDMTNIDPDGDGDPDDETVAPFVPSSYLVSFFWIDEDGDGLKESGEPPLVGATVILYDSTGNEVARTITDEAGLFIFTVPPNEYEMEFISPSGFVFSPMGDENIPFRNAADQNGRLALSLDGGENELEVGGGIVSAPTAVELNEFSIALRETKEGDEIVIRWETALELDTAGFHILRSSDGIQTSARRMTTHLIPSQDITGGSYEVILPYDHVTEPPLRLLSFWLLEIENDDTIHYHGPLTIDLNSSQIDQFVFLPFLNQ